MLALKLDYLIPKLYLNLNIMDIRDKNGFWTQVEINKLKYTKKYINV